MGHRVTYWGEDDERYHVGIGSSIGDQYPDQPHDYHHHVYLHHPSRTRSTGEPASVFCPEGSAMPKPATGGFYTTGGNSTHNRTRTWQVICEAGHYCEGGRKFRCPPGRYGTRKGLTSEACDGFCPAGHFCSFGTVRATQFPCPVGSYSSAGAFNCTVCPRTVNLPGPNERTICKNARHCCH